MNEIWKQEGTLILAWGIGGNPKTGAVICKLAEPYPPSGLAEWMPLRLDSKNWNEQMTRAAAIEAVPEMIAALHAAVAEIERLSMVTGYTGVGHFDLIDRIKQVLKETEKASA